jgi:hypothetical protein
MTSILSHPHRPGSSPSARTVQLQVQNSGDESHTLVSFDGGPPLFSLPNIPGSSLEFHPSLDVQGRPGVSALHAQVLLMHLQTSHSPGQHFID